MRRFHLSTLLARRVSDLGGQTTLVSGVNIKTINGVSVLGSGNIAVEGGTPYTHPAAHPATMITEDITHRFVTDTEKTGWNNLTPNVNADWNAIGGDAQILNKPSIPVVSDTAYSASSWDGNTDVPTKNVIRDKFESLSTGSVPTAWGKYF